MPRRSIISNPPPSADNMFLPYQGRPAGGRTVYSGTVLRAPYDAAVQESGSKRRVSRERQVIQASPSYRTAGLRTLRKLATAVTTSRKAADVKLTGHTAVIFVRRLEAT